MRSYDGYTIEDARRALASGNRAVFSDGEHGAASLAIREYERAEALARRVADLEARALRAEAAVGRLYIGPPETPRMSIAELFDALAEHIPPGSLCSCIALYGETRDDCSEFGLCWATQDTTTSPTAGEE